MSNINRKVLPGFSLTLGYSMFYMSMLILIPIAATFARGASIGWNEFFKTVNRYRDVTLRPDGLALFVATDVEGNTQDQSGRPAVRVENPGAILEFRYVPDRPR